MFSLNDYLAGAGQGKFDALSSLYENAFICAHRVIALNLKATQSLMEGNLSEVRALLEAKDAASLYEAQSDMARKLIQQAVGYAVGFQEVVAENQQKLSNLSEVVGEDGTPLVPGASAAPLMINVVNGLLDTAARSRDAMMEMARQVDEGLTQRPPSGR
ncbi:MAG: phasin family protein [Zoogloea sp.]|uniref:phasin family protein n=1 Tax=Zoogloea sp. TaxID=49181 RepID=UPI0026395850|nr:phasin family protein [Zoogloea sp.]MDD3327809.1 phasin family protein [Zoogloea sp.]